MLRSDNLLRLGLGLGSGRDYGFKGRVRARVRVIMWEGLFNLFGLNTKHSGQLKFPTQV